MRNLVCLLLCGAGALFLTASDAFINISASDVIGSSPESQASAQYVAIGVTLALLALGSIASILNNKLAQMGLWLVVGVAAVYSGVLTVQAVSIDYTANDHSGAIQSERRHANEQKIAQYNFELKELKRKMRECELDRYFTPCQGTEARIAALSGLIAQSADDNVASKMAQKIDITDAVEQKAGIPGLWVERIGIYSRAIAVPLLMSLLMMGFWFFWERLWKGSEGSRLKHEGSRVKKAVKPDLSEPIGNDSGTVREPLKKVPAAKEQGGKGSGGLKVSHADREKIKKAMFSLANSRQKPTLVAVQKKVGLRRQTCSIVYNQNKSAALAAYQKVTDTPKLKAVG